MIQASHLESDFEVEKLIFPFQVVITLWVTTHDQIKVNKRF